MPLPLGEWLEIFVKLTLPSNSSYESFSLIFRISTHAHLTHQSHTQCFYFLLLHIVVQVPIEVHLLFLYHLKGHQAIPIWEKIV